MKKILTTLLLIGTLSIASAQTSLFQGGTGLSTSTPGDLIVGTSSTLRYSRLPRGTAGTVLQAISTHPFMAWIATSSLGLATGTNMWGGNLSGDIFNLNSGEVGIGTTTPSSLLSIASSTASGTSRLFGVGTSTDILTVLANGNVAISGNAILNRYGSGQLRITGDGTGTALGTTGWILGVGSGGNNQAGIYHSLNGAPSATNYTVLVDGVNAYFNNPSGGSGALVLAIGNTIKGLLYGTAGKGMDITAGTATTDVNALNITQTWNNSGVTFTAIESNVTDTASGASSLLMDLQVGASSMFKVSKAGLITTPASGGGIVIGDNGITSNTNVFYTAANGNYLLAMRGAESDIRMPGTTATFGFNSGSTAYGTALDTSMSRLSAGVLGIGTGAFGSMAGTLVANILNATTTNVTNASTTAISGSGLSFTNGFISALTGVNSSFTNSTSTNFFMSGGTKGSVVFLDTGGLLTQNNSKFFWDNGANFLGISSSSPKTSLVVGSGSATISELVLSTSTNMTVYMASSTTQHMQLGSAAVSLTIVPNGGVGNGMKLKVCNPATTAGALTFFSSTTITWAGITAPTQTTAANRCDMYSFLYGNATGTAISIFGAITSF
jgi:hypothetical protein